MRATWIGVVLLIPFYCFGALLWTPLFNVAAFLPVYLSIMLGLSWVIVRANDALKIAWLKKGAEATEIWRFLDPTDPQNQCEIELIPATGEKWIPNSPPRTKPTFYEIYGSPALPPCVAIRGGTRTLSAEEAEEIRRVVDQGRYAAWKPFATIFFLAVLSAIFFDSASEHLGALLFALVFLIVAALNSITMVRQLYANSRLSRDLRQRLVKDVGRKEILPRSRLEWTVNGDPAPWREIGSQPSPQARSTHQLPEA